MRTLISIFLLSVFLAGCASQPPVPLPPDTPVTSEPEIPLELNPTKEPPTIPADPTMPTQPPASGGLSPENPLAPRSGDAKLTRGVVFLDAASLLIMESYPIQVSVSFEGNLPTPCHELRAVIAPPDSENRINIDLYTVYDEYMICIQVLKEFYATLPLGSFPPGHYTVLVNSEAVGEFDS